MTIGKAHCIFRNNPDHILDLKSGLKVTGYLAWAGSAVSECHSSKSMRKSMFV